MSVVTKTPSENRIILHDVSWNTYESLLKDFESCSSPHIAYDQGVMEIVSPQAEHEDAEYLISAIIEIMIAEMDVDFRSLGSTTFKREALKRGFEPDACFYIASVDKIPNKKKIDLEVDPPPDLIVEVDITNDSLNKIPIYKALRIPEVWRYEDTLEIRILEGDRYVEGSASVALPLLTAKFVAELIATAASMKRPAWLRDVRQRIRALLA